MRYLNVVLTIIAVELGWLALTHSATPVSAQQVVTPVVITGVESGIRALPVTLVGQERPLMVEADPPLRVQVPVVSSTELGK